MPLYAIFYLSAFLLFGTLAWWLCRRAGLAATVPAVLLVQYLLAMGPCAHIAYFVVAERTVVNSVLQTLVADMFARPETSSLDSSLLAWAQGWFKSTGGLWGGPFFALGLTLLLVVAMRTDRDVKARMLDVLAVAFPFAYALAKVGCFVNGCCHGVSGDGLPFVHMTWVETDSPAHGLTCFPTALLDALVLAAIGSGLAWTYHHERQQGRLVLWFVAWLSVGRFATEWTRGDAVGGFVIEWTRSDGVGQLARGLSPVQIVLVGALGLSGWLLLAPRHYQRILSWRGPAPSIQTDRWSRDDRSGLLLRKRQRNLLVALVALTVLGPLTVLLPLLFVAPLALHLVRLRAARPSVATWAGTFNAFCYVGYGVVELAAFLIWRFEPAIALVVLFEVALVALLARAPAEALRRGVPSRAPGEEQRRDDGGFRNRLPTAQRCE